MGYRMTSATVRLPGVYVFVIGDEHTKNRRSASDSLDNHCRQNSFRHRVVQREDDAWAAKVLSATPFYHVITILGVMDGHELQDFWASLHEDDAVHLLVLDDAIPLACTFGSQVETWRPCAHSGVPYAHIVRSIVRKLRG